MNNANIAQAGNGRSTPVHRSNETLAMGIAGGALLGFLSVYLWSTQHEVWSLVVAFLALAITFAGFDLSWRANCPVCRTPLNGLSSGVCGPCGNCMHYLKMEHHRMSPLEADYIASIPMFAVPWDSLDGAPPRCCGCGQEAVRLELISSFAFRGLSLSAQMPHCETCRKGACIQQGNKVTSDSVTADPTTYISVAVKSHRFYHEVMMMHQAAYSSRG